MRLRRPLGNIRIRCKRGQDDLLVGRLLLVIRLKCFHVLV